MLTKHQIQDYNNNGFIVIEELLSKNEIRQTRDIIDQFIEKSRDIKESDNIFDLEDDHSRNSPRLTRVKQPHLINDHFFNLIKNSKITKALKDLLGKNILLKSSKLNTKFEKGGSAVEWHQDWAFYPHTNDVGCAVGIYLDDVAEDNGPMMIIPRSHKGPIIDHNSKGFFCGAIDPIKSPLDYDSAIPLMGPAGTMTIHHVRTIHGSALNHSQKPRRLLLQGYFAADAWPIRGFRPGQTLDDFNALVVRGEPTLEPRLANVPVRMPYPEAPHQGSIYENQHILENRFFESVGEHKDITAEPA